MENTKSRKAMKKAKKPLSELEKTVNQMIELLNSSSFISIKYIELLAYIDSFTPISKDLSYCFFTIITSRYIIELTSSAQTIDSSWSPFLSYLLKFHKTVCRQLLKSPTSPILSNTFLNHLKNLYHDRKIILEKFTPTLPPLIIVKLTVLSKIIAMFTETPYLWTLRALRSLIEKSLRSAEFPVFACLTPPFLPKSEENKPTLVLDLDETLIHMNGETLLVRPGAEEFLQKTMEKFEVVLFTASTACHADFAMKKIDPDGKVKLRLYREHLRFDELGPYKDLTLLGRELARTIIVDNSSSNFRHQQQCGIEIATWTGDSNDDHLQLIFDSISTKLNAVKI
jgi:hypothetical protein